MFLGGMCVCVWIREGGGRYMDMFEVFTVGKGVAVTQVSGNTRFNFSFS